MADMDWDAYLSAIRGNDRVAFGGLVASPGDLEFKTTNMTRYASWFSGIGFTLLQLTAFLRSEWALVLLDRGASMDLHSACALGDVDMIKRLLDEDSRAYERSIDTYVPAQFALGHPEALRALLEHGDNANRPIHKLAWFDWDDPASERGVSDWRLVHMVGVGRGKGVETAEVLREFGADLQATASPFGDAAIHLAAIYDRAELIRWFVEQGVDVDIPTADPGLGVAAGDLFEAEPFGPFEGHGKTSLMLALGEGQTNAVDALLDLGADVHAKDSLGHTPMHYAAGAFWKEEAAHVERLIGCGADLAKLSQDGQSPLDLAKKKGYQETIALLERVD